VHQVGKKDYHYIRMHCQQNPKKVFIWRNYGDADKSLARRGRKQTVPVKSVVGRGMD